MTDLTTQPKTEESESTAKEPYRRGIYHRGPGITNKVLSKLDEGVPEKAGRREEVKILETHNRVRVKKQLLLIRKFLKMDLSQIKIHDERGLKIKVED